MKELSLNILDIAENSVKAKATLVEIILKESEKELELIIRDDGCGMPEEIVRGVTDPFYTTRTTRKVGMGIPLLKLAAEQAGGRLEISSLTANDDPINHGTRVKATFYTNNIDFTPIGDIVSTICVIIQGHPEINYVFRHITPEKSVELDTRQMREVLGEDVSLGEPEVIAWISEFLKEQYL